MLFGIKNIVIFLLNFVKKVVYSRK